MFSYYGSKSKIVDYYPNPKHNKIIEPFAGSARYSLKYFEKDITIVDKFDTIVNIWKWLQKCSPGDIIKSPYYSPGEYIIENDCSCNEHFQLLRYLYQQGTVGGNKVYEWGFKSYPQNLKRIAENLFKIKHWNIILGTYEDIENINATWFIDPPYQNGGHKYKCNNKKIDFNKLASYCMERNGQVIVCENTKANWMDFHPLVEMQGIKHKTTEAIWTNDINIDIQTRLF